MNNKIRTNNCPNIKVKSNNLEIYKISHQDIKALAKLTSHLKLINTQSFEIKITLKLVTKLQG